MQLLLFWRNEQLTRQPGRALVRILTDLENNMFVSLFVFFAEIIGHVRNGQQQSHGKPVLRPTVDDDLVDEEVVQMMKRCWVEDPNERPDFPVLKATIRRLNK